MHRNSSYSICSDAVCTILFFQTCQSHTNIGVSPKQNINIDKLANLTKIGLLSSLYHHYWGFIYAVSSNMTNSWKRGQLRPCFCWHKSQRKVVFIHCALVADGVFHIYTNRLLERHAWRLTATPTRTRSSTFYTRLSSHCVNHASSGKASLTSKRRTEWWLPTRPSCGSSRPDSARRWKCLSRTLANPCCSRRFEPSSTQMKSWRNSCWKRVIGKDVFVVYWTMYIRACILLNNVYTM